MFRIGASATVIRQFLLPVLAGSPGAGASHATEVQGDLDIERRLHDLTLDFGVVGSASLSRPLQTKVLGKWKLELWVPGLMGLNETAVRREFEAQRLPLVLARNELEPLAVGTLAKYPAQLECDNFLEARKALKERELAAFLPDFLMGNGVVKDYLRVNVPQISGKFFQFYLAWNPRLLRLNSHAGRKRDLLAELLAKRMAGR
jgi:DNA-binding transcriptional LysR family regulator